MTRARHLNLDGWWAPPLIYDLSSGFNVEFHFVSFILLMSTADIKKHYLPSCAYLFSGLLRLENGLLYTWVMVAIRLKIHKFSLQQQNDKQKNLFISIAILTILGEDVFFLSWKMSISNCALESIAFCLSGDVSLFSFPFNRHRPLNR